MFYHCATQPGEEHAHTPTDLTAIFHVTWISRLLFFMTWNPTTSHWLKHLIWLRTAHSGSCWQCLVLCTLVLQDNNEWIHKLFMWIWLGGCPILHLFETHATLDVMFAASGKEEGRRKGGSCTQTSTGQPSFAVSGPRTWNRSPAALC